MVQFIQKFLITYIIIFCIQMIYFFFRNKSKKYGKLPTTAMVYLIKLYNIDVLELGLSYVEKHIALINSFIVTCDLLIYFYIESIILKYVIMFATTVMLVFIFYSILGNKYKKMLNSWSMIKKILFIIISFMLVGCTKGESIEKNIYDSYIEIVNSKKDSDYIPFNVSVYVDKLTDDEVMYRLIIDSPKESLYEVEALVIHDKDTEDIFPSSGIFDTKYNLLKDEVDKDKNNVRGIILIGYIKYKGDIDKINTTFKVLVKYRDNNNKEHVIIYSTKK